MTAAEAAALPQMGDFDVIIIGGGIIGAMIARQLEEFKARGFGGVTVKDTTNMPRDEKTQHIADIDYMCPKWLEMFEVTFTTIQ